MKYIYFILLPLQLVLIKTSATLEQHPQPQTEVLPTNQVGTENLNDPITADAYEWSTSTSVKPFNIQLNCRRLSPTKPCIRKCCKWNYYLHQKQCLKTNDTGLDLDIHNGTAFISRAGIQDAFLVVYGRMVGCTQLLYKLSSEIEEDRYFVQKNGTLWVGGYVQKNGTTNGTSWVGGEYLEGNRFCLDYGLEEAEGGGRGEMQVLVCFPEEQLPQMSKAQFVGMIVSVPFLVLTLLVYIILPDRNIPAKILMCFVSTLILAYVFLISLQIGSMADIERCEFIAIICHYFFLSSFLWMNVSCIDIYWTFSGLRGFGGSKRADLKRFILYVAYASGFPLLISGGVFALNYHPDTKAWFHPKIGHGRCWLEEKTPVLLYFYGPLGLIICANIILFVLTSLKIRRVRKDTVMLKRADSRRHNADEKERFNLYVKLLFAMGVNWSLEIISWALITYSRVAAEYWIITDFCNAIYGVSIFFIFVFKRKTLAQIKKRYNHFRRRSDATGTMQDETENTLTSSVSQQKNSMLLK